MVDYGIARAKYLDTPIYRAMPRMALRRPLRARRDGALVENLKWSEVSKRFGK